MSAPFRPGVTYRLVTYLRTAVLWGMHNPKTTISGIVAGSAFVIAHKDELLALTPMSWHKAALAVVSVAMLVMGLASMDSGRIVTAGTPAAVPAVTPPADPTVAVAQGQTP